MSKLTLSSTDSVIAGVCGGLGEYFDIDPIIFRLLFVLLLFGGGCALIAYFILWIVMPHES